jgi:hypothetical protein
MGTLSFSNLGTYGWYGNQLYQIASTIGIAVSNDMDYMFPTWKYSKYFKKELPQLPKEELDKIKGTYIDREGPHHFEKVLIPDPTANWDIGGYLQSEKYFEHCRDLVFSYLELKDEYEEYIQNKFNHILNLKNCAIHVRRDDYLNFPSYHPVMNMNYYSRAMTYFDSDTKFIVFSNDMNWCKNNFIGDQFIFIEDGDKTRGGDVIVEHSLMSKCQNIITANSSFSLWASILNKNENKKIICPSNWFGPAISGYRLDDMYPKNAIII